MTWNLLPFGFGRKPVASSGWLSESVSALEERTRKVVPISGSAVLRRYTNERPLRVELMGWEAVGSRREDWSELLDRVIEPNVFLEPAFALSAAQHFAMARRPGFLLVTDLSAHGDRGELIGLCGLTLPRRGFGTIARAWSHDHAVLGTPLLDRTRGAEAFDMMLAWLAREQRHVNALMLPYLAAGGPAANLIRTRALARDLEIKPFDLRQRAVLSGGRDPEQLMAETLMPERRRNLRRQRRRLEELGAFSYQEAWEPRDVRVAAERFLALEASGWKGKRGTALLSDMGLATFARTMTRLLAHEGKCRIDSLEINGQPIAMGIILYSGGEAFLWKIAYDETYAAYSPGVQFVLEFTSRQLKDPSISFTDSCAIPDHPMINRFWPDRMPIVDLLVATSPERTSAFAATAAREGFRRRLRARVKSAYYRLSGKSAS